MKLLFVIFMGINCLGLSAKASGYCTDPFVGKWKCDQDFIARNIEIMFVPRGHATGLGIFALVNTDSRITELAFELGAPFGDGSGYYPAKGICTSKGTIDVQYKDRPVDYRKTEGMFSFSLEGKDSNGNTELHIRSRITYPDGSYAMPHAVCRKML